MLGDLATRVREPAARTARHPEDVFDVGDRLDRITAPTLVIGGAKDVFYTRALFEQTAAGVKDGRVHIYPDWGHGRTATSATTAHLALGFFLAADAR